MQLRRRRRRTGGREYFPKSQMGGKWEESMGCWEWNGRRESREVVVWVTHLRPTCVLPMGDGESRHAPSHPSGGRIWKWGELSNSSANGRLMEMTALSFDVRKTDFPYRTFYDGFSRGRQPRTRSWLAISPSSLLSKASVRKRRRRVAKRKTRFSLRGR